MSEVDQFVRELPVAFALSVGMLVVVAFGVAALPFRPTEVRTSFGRRAVAVGFHMFPFLAFLTPVVAAHTPSTDSRTSTVVFAASVCAFLIAQLAWREALSRFPVTSQLLKDGALLVEYRGEKKA